MEYGGNKTLKKFIDDKNSNNELIKPETINSIIKQICLGLKEIHNAGITHRDNQQIYLLMKIYESK